MSYTSSYMAGPLQINESGSGNYGSDGNPEEMDLFIDLGGTANARGLKFTGDNLLIIHLVENTGNECDGAYD